MNTSLQKIASCLLVCSLLTTGAGAANKKTVKPTKPKPKKNTELTLIEAYTQRTIGGAAGSAPPPSGTFIVVRWDRQDSIPLGFFWRGENGYLPCQIARAHKAQFKDPKNAPPG
ncbi:MAG: hypothetical protein EBZ77_04430, partial [Chitinophagia bacterium]|nr:hypothetical protein [Chitinophagia bacterium]